MRHALFSTFTFSLLLTGLATAQVRDCQTGDLSVGGSAEAALDANDCALRDAIGSGTSTAFAKRFNLTVNESAVVTLNLTSPDFDTFLYLLATGPTRQVGFNDNAADHPTNSRLVASLPAGQYVVVATSPRPGLSGTFKLSAAGEAPRECPVAELAVGAVYEGAFTETSCRFLDLLPLSTNNAYIQFFDMRLPKNGVLSVTADTALAGFSSVVSIGTQVGFSGAKEIVASLPGGEAAFSVSARGEGAYKLNAVFEDPRPCPQQQLAVGAEDSASLDPGGCRVLDVILPSATRRPLKLYRISVDRPTIATLDEKSQLMDSFLYLFDTQFRTIATNDDVDRTTTDSRLQIHLPAGNYVAGASTFEPAEANAFTFKMTGDAPRTCPSPDLVSGEAAEGTLSAAADGCRHLDLVPFSQISVNVAPFKLNAQARKTVGLSLQSNAAGQFLSILTPGGTEVYRNTVSTNDRTLTFKVTTLPGVHTVMLYTGAAVPPTYKLSATIADPKSCPAADLGPNDAQDGTLVGADCQVWDVAPYFVFGSQVRTYRVTLPERGRHSITMEPGAGFSPAMIAMRGTDSIIGQTSQGPAGQRITLTGILPAGEYRFQLTTLGAPGPFTVRSAFTPEAAGTASKSKQTAEEGTMEEAGGSLRDSMLFSLEGHSASTPLFQKR